MNHTNNSYKNKNNKMLISTFINKYLDISPENILLNNNKYVNLNELAEELNKEINYRYNTISNDKNYHKKSLFNYGKKIKYKSKKNNKINTIHKKKKSK